MERIKVIVSCFFMLVLIIFCSAVDGLLAMF